MRRRFGWISLALAATFLAVSPHLTVGDQKKVRLAFITNSGVQFWAVCRAGCNKAAQDNPNIDVDFEIPSDASAAGQKRIMDDLLAKGIDGVAISPVDPVNETPMLNDATQQAVVFTSDSDAPNSQRACYVGTDNVKAGQQAGGLIKEAIPNGGKIMLFVGKLDAQNAADRINGIKQALAGSNVQIIDIRTDDVDPVRAKANAQDTLVKYPDIAALVGLWSYNGPAILSAVRDAGKANQVKIVCFDDDQDTLSGIKSGEIYATVVQQPFEFGYQSMMMMAKLVGGDKSAVPDDKHHYIETIALKKDDVDQYQANLKKILGN